jgi:hypothetical protein
VWRVAVAGVAACFAPVVEAVDVGKAVMCCNSFPLHAVSIAIRRAANSRNMFVVDIGVGYAIEVSANYMKFP